MQTRFAVFSDIHFRKGIAGEIYDPDDEVRHEVLRDLDKMSNEVGDVFGILVNGDVAYRGAPDEYAIATKFLNQACAALGCPTHHVWTVPGNHDVDRSAIDSSKILRSARQEMRRCDLDRIEDVIREWSMDAAGASELYRPLAAYNEFAANYECEISAAQPVWQYPVELNDGSLLCIVGLNSTLCCDAADSKKADELKVVLGMRQATMVRRMSGVTYLALCHHPTSWFRDEDLVTDALCYRHQIQIFGHEHVQSPYPRNNSYILRVGALQPSRNEPGWEPRYNIIGVHVETTGSDRTLSLEVWPRVWDRTRQFVADRSPEGTRSNVYRLPLESWTPAPAPMVPALENPGGAANAGVPAAPSLLPPGGLQYMDAKRQLVHHFLTLAHPARVAIAVDLRLTRDEDNGVRDQELVGRYLARAKAAHQLGQLWRAVEERHPQGTPEPNPFV